MGSRINKACDGCRFRKVRCNGAHPCSQCAHLDLPCAFSPPAAKRKPGVRGRLVAQLRGSGDARAPTSPSSASTAASGSPAVTSVAGIINPDSVGPEALGAATPPGGTEYPPDFLGLVPEFERVIYPVNPIITPEELRATVTTMGCSHEDTALVFAFAAATINLTQTAWPLRGDAVAQMTDLLRRSLEAHRRAELADLVPSSGPPALGELGVSVKRIMTCVLLEMSMNTFKTFDRGFAILREAIALTETLRVFRYGRDDALLDRREVARRQRLYWECFIHERYLNIVCGGPAVLPPLSTGLPFPDPSIPSYVDVGFRRLIRLFRVMDDTFLTFWNADHHDPAAVPEMTAAWVEGKQAELDQDERDTAADEDRVRAGGGTGLTELQHVDLFITRLWLRTLVWQLALSRGLLRSAPPRDAHQGLSLHFPARRLSAQLRSLVGRLESVASIGTHGSGILQKLFEITTTVADVLALPPGGGGRADDLGARIGDVEFLVAFLLRFERTPVGEREYMREKLEVLRQMHAVDMGEYAARSA